MTSPLASSIARRDGSTRWSRINLSVTTGRHRAVVPLRWTAAGQAALWRSSFQTQTPSLEPRRHNPRCSASVTIQEPFDVCVSVTAMSATFHHVTITLPSSGIAGGDGPRRPSAVGLGANEGDGIVGALHRKHRAVEHDGCPGSVDPSEERCALRERQHRIEPAAAHRNQSGSGGLQRTVTRQVGHNRCPVHWLHCMCGDQGVAERSPPTQHDSPHIDRQPHARQAPSLSSGRAGIPSRVGTRQHEGPVQAHRAFTHC